MPSCAASAVALQGRPPGAARASLQAIATWVPERAVRVETLGRHLDLSPVQMKVLTRIHGLAELRAGSGATVLSGLVEAGERALRGVEDRQCVRFVLYAHTLTDVAPSTVNVVRDVTDALGLTGATAFSLTQQNCASGLLAIDVAAKLLADDTGLALVLMGEQPFTPLAQLIPGTTIMGEAAAACLVGPGDGPDRVLAYASRTRGQYSAGLGLDPAILRSFEHEYVDTLAAVMLEAIAAAGLELGDIALVLPHNVNRTSWVRLARHLELPLDRLLLSNIPRFAHCYCADPFLNYVSAVEQGRLRPGDHYLMAAVGLGATFTAIALRH